MMIRINLLCVVVAGLSLGTMSAAPLQDAAQDRVRDLEAKLAASEKRNAELEKQLVEVAAQNGVLAKEKRNLLDQLSQMQNRLTAERVGRPAEPNRIPDNWKPFQFNGSTCYLVPLNDGQAVRSAKAVAK